MYAIIGASNNKEKYGHKITKSLLEKGFEVVPVNPKGGEILKQKVALSLSDVKEKIDMVVFVTPHNVTEKVLEEVKKLRLKKVWFQPGSESEKAIQFCKDNNINYTYNACIMIQT